ncbi:MAG: hypothetical protein JNL60_08975 [Bacteroidia bacterium]|nr:hypothetical protein [Bacteroidia bacterium]
MTKNINLFSLTLSALCIFSLNIYGQDSLQERSITVIRRGVEYHDDKKYDLAVAEFMKVHRNDSNYYLASVEILTTYLAQTKNKEGLALCNELLKLKNEYTPNILKYKADFLDNLEKYEEAEKIYKQGIKDYPVNHSFYYELAISKMHQKKNNEAFTLLVSALKKNPFHTSSHHQLGVLAYRNNNLTAASLALQFYLICDADSRRARGIVADLEKMLKLELETDSVTPLKAFEGENDFSELESVLRSKAALSEKFKTKTDLTYDLTKQVQVIIENIGKYRDVKGFYNEFYGTFFTELNKNNFLEVYVYYMLRGMELEKVNKWLQKNKSEVDRFENWYYNYVCNNFAKYEENLNGTVVSVPHWFSYNVVFGAGVMLNNQTTNGYWNYYYDNGIKKAEGEFVNGKKNKTWKYYHENGGIKEEIVYDNGLEKLYRSFYENNNPKVEVPVVNNKMEGERKTYFSNGNISSSTEYKAGEINGKETFYYRNGSLRYTLTNVKDVLSGDLIEYYDNGKKRQTVKFVNGLREGPGKSYFNNSTNSVDEEGEYVKNKCVGEWKGYFRSGKLYEVKNYNKDGMLDGKRTEYYENGKLAEEEAYTDGKINGLTKTYSDDGTLWEEFLYKKGKLVEYRAYKKDGSKICDNKINGKNYEVTLYHPNGIKRRQGKVSDGELEGPWRDYSLFGILIRETNYKEGLSDGVWKEYYHSGKVKRQSYYIKGEEEGEYTSYFENGKISSRGMISAGEKTGFWTFWYADGTLKNRYYYVNDELEGWNEHFDVNGKMSSEDLYKDFCLVKVLYHDTNGIVSQNLDLPGGTGLLEMKTLQEKVIYKCNFLRNSAEGVTESYYPDGKVETRVEYKKGKKEGKSLSYNPMGVLLSDLTYFNNEREGKEVSYDDDGKIIKESIYDNDELHGLSTNYHSNGKIYRSLNYKYGEAEGESEVMDETGQLIYKRFFHRDLLVNYTYKDAKGELLAPMEVPPGEAKVLCFYQNGKKSFEATYLNGDLQGTRKVYFSNGNLMDETEYSYDWLHGVSKSYYSNGNLKEKGSYYYGDINGKEESFYENGKLKSEKNYKLGKEHGWFRYFDATGKLVKSVFYYNGNPIIIE